MPYLIATILGFIIEILIFKNVIIDAHAGLLNSIIVTAIVMPISFFIVFSILIGIASIINEHIEDKERARLKKLIEEGKIDPEKLRQEAASKKASTYKKPEPKKNSYWNTPIDHATVARCDILLNLLKSLEYTEVWNDLSIRDLKSKIEINKINDQFEANILCNVLEQRLINDYYSAVASTPEGYRWLRSKKMF